MFHHGKSRRDRDAPYLFADVAANRTVPFFPLYPPLPFPRPRSVVSFLFPPFPRSLFFYRFDRTLQIAYRLGVGSTLGRLIATFDPVVRS